MKNVLVLLVFVVGFVLMGCYMVNGVGKDVKLVGILLFKVFGEDGKKK